MLHRSLWSFVFVWAVLVALRRLQWVPGVVRRPRLVAQFALSALLLSTNWLLYVWAVNHGHVVEASLGYFVTPLVNVLLGTWVLKERPRRLQWVAVAMAASGVLWLTLALGRPPWIALGLAGSFGSYGLLRKTAPLGALEGLAVETAVMAPIALVALAVDVRARTAACPACSRAWTRHRRLAALRRPAHRDPAAAVRRRRPPHHAGDAGHAAVLVADDPVPAGRDLLRRAAGGARGWSASC